MSEWFESSDLDYVPNPTENDNITLEDALVLINENTVDIAQLQKDYTDLLKKIISIQSGIASIEKRIPPIPTIQAYTKIQELKDSVNDDTARILKDIENS